MSLSNGPRSSALQECRKLTDLIWPTTAGGWRDAFERGLDVNPTAGTYRHARGEMESGPFVRWIESEFAESRGYHRDFAPALTRNIRGLLAWAYADGPEPFWSGSDTDPPHE